jgi:hypothetical protein
MLCHVDHHQDTGDWSAEVVAQSGSGRVNWKSYFKSNLLIPLDLLSSTSLNPYKLYI